jgi:hypothetical protein
MKKQLTLLLILFLVVFSSCSGDDEITSLSNCDSISEIIAENDFNTIDTTNYSISSVNLNGDCLEITLSASGCDSSLWVMQLYSKNASNNLLPLQRDVKIKLINNQLCQAVFQSTISFDLVPLRIQGQNSILLNIDDWDMQVVYNY